MQGQCTCDGRAETYASLSAAGFDCGEVDNGCGEVIYLGKCTDSAQCYANVCKKDELEAIQWRLTCLAGTQDRWWVRTLVERFDIEPYSDFSSK